MVDRCSGKKYKKYKVGMDIQLENSAYSIVFHRDGHLRMTKIEIVVVGEYSKFIDP